jgi:transposase-like protein
VSDTELLHKSKGEPLRRLEVFTGSGRRRAWSAEQKARILAKSYESGDEVSAVARWHGLTPEQLFGWRRDVRRRSTRRQSNDAAEMRASRRFLWRHEGLTRGRPWRRPRW